MENLFAKAGNLKHSSTYLVFWGLKDQYHDFGRTRVSTVVTDLLYLLSQITSLLTGLNNPKLEIFNEFKYQIYQVLVKNFDPNYLYNTYNNINPKNVKDINWNYQTIKNELCELENEKILKEEHINIQIEDNLEMKEKTNIKKSKEENMETSEKIDPSHINLQNEDKINIEENKLKVLDLETKSDLKISDKEIDNHKKNINETDQQNAKATQNEELKSSEKKNEIKSENIDHCKIPEKEENRLINELNADTNKKENLNVTKAINLEKSITTEKEILGKSLQKSSDSQNKFVKIICISNPQKYSFSYLNDFSVKVFSNKKNPKSVNKPELISPNFPTIYNYIFSVYCLLPTKSQETCKKIASNLKHLDDSEFNKFCQLKAKNLSHKSNLLTQFFREKNIKIWNIYQLEKHFDDLENDNINEIDKIIETGKFNEVNQRVKDFFNNNNKKN